MKLKEYNYYGAVFSIGINRTPAGHYYAEKRTKKGTERHCFSEDYIFDHCDDENWSWDRSAARLHIAELFK